MKPLFKFLGVIFLSLSVMSSYAYSKEYLLGGIKVEIPDTIPFKIPVTDEADTECLAQVIYHEARGESLKGQIAVANVVLNRMNDARYPAAICPVVYQKYKGVCQFSWVCDKRIPRTPRNSQDYENIKILANDLIIQYNEYKLDDVTEGALFFHSRKIPVRSRSLEKSAMIGNHVFLRYRYVDRPKAPIGV